MVGTRVRQSVMFAHLVPPQRATDPSPVPLRLVKAITYHQLDLGETAQGWRAQVYVDI